MQPALLLVGQTLLLLQALLLLVLLVLLLLQLLQALGHLLIEGEKRMGWLVAQGLEDIAGKDLGKIGQGLLQALLIGGHGLVLLIQALLCLLLRVAGGLHLLGQSGGVFLQGEQGALALLVAVDFFFEAAQLAVQPGTAGAVGLGAERWPQGVRLQLLLQRLQLFAQL